MKKAKFNVGDKVRILNGSKIKNYTGGWCMSMSDYVGEIHTITFVDTSYSDERIGYRVTDIPCIYDERGLELINHETIVIYRNGNEVIALDKSTGKKAVAKCSPKDEFDFSIGAKLAFERLFRGPHEFKVGDKIIGTAEASKHYSITREGWIGTVTKVVGSWIKARSGSSNTEFDLNPKYFVLADPAKIEEAKSKYFTGKVVCVKAKSSYYTEGKIYEIKDGVGYDNDGDVMTPVFITSVKHLNQRLCSEFMEIIE